MTHRSYNVLFLCTGNSARSILGEALANDPTINQGRLRGYSAGSFPKSVPNPYALDLLRAQGLPVDGLRSKRWDEFAQPGAPVMDFIFTVCDAAAGETCPLWPGQPISAHWGIPDPAAIEGSDEQKRQAFLEAYGVLRRRIELLASLPFDQLDHLALQGRLRALGRA